MPDLPPESSFYQQPQDILLAMLTLDTSAVWSRIGGWILVAADISTMWSLLDPIKTQSELKNQISSGAISS